MKLLGFCLFLLTLGCGVGAPKPPSIDSSSSVFRPEFKGGSNPEGAPQGNPLVPANLRAFGLAGAIRLEFDIPKTYVTPSLKIGYRVFRKLILTDAQIEWDFSQDISLDWQDEIATLAASECDAEGKCVYLDDVGGAAAMNYAIIAYWDIEDFDSARSEHVTIGGKSSLREVDLLFDVGFMNQPPLQVMGVKLNPIDQLVDSAVYNLVAEQTPWYMRSALETASTEADWKRLASPTSSSLNAASTEFILLDRGFNRSMVFSRGFPEQDCLIFPEESRDLCTTITLSKPLLPLFAVGQTSLTTDADFDANPLDVTRKLRARAVRSDMSASGQVYRFFSDDARILVRRGDMQGCEFDEGVDLSEPVSGDCGFQWSIGTYSPRQRCQLDSVSSELLVADEQCDASDLEYSLADTTAPSDTSLRLPGAPKIVGDHLYIPDTANARLVRMANFEQQLETCGRLLSEAEETYSAATVSLGAGFELRTKKRGSSQNNIRVELISIAAAPSVDVAGAGTSEDPYVFTLDVAATADQAGLADLFTGVSPLVDVTPGASAQLVETFSVFSFEGTSLFSLGSFSAAGGEEPKNELCRFDQVVGQYLDDAEDPARFSERDCVRGGERGGFDGLAALAETAAFADPLLKAGRGGAVCRLDTVDDGSGPRPSRFAGDLKDSFLSDINPSSGELTTRSRKMFRAPVKLEVDANGWLYVLDMGFTGAEAAGSGLAASLPPRIMVWRQDPFSRERCVAEDPENPSCSEPEPGVCEGEGCQSRQCIDTECAAQIFIGQPTNVAGFLHESDETLGEDVSPDGYFPISDFGVGEVANMVGLWVVSGRDERVFHFTEISQTALPIVHNDASSRDPADTSDFRDGVFSGIVVDNFGQKIITIDSETSRAAVWGGVIPPRDSSEP